ncbi:MAG TPA: hypothetical protein PLQ20_00150 [Candidatus Paceibacterota bacterium]|nr:hypothetical protein [Candidatus Paceibacterota bacterium]
MKNIIKNLIIVLSLLFMVVGSIYQMVDSFNKNVPGDGKIVSGDNPIFRNILGVKKTYGYLEPGYGWHRYRTDIETPSWMQTLLNLPKKVSYGQKDPNNWTDPDNEQSFFRFNTICIVLLRWSIKLFFPIIFILLAYRFLGPKKVPRPRMFG